MQDKGEYDMNINIIRMKRNAQDEHIITVQWVAWLEEGDYRAKITGEECFNRVEETTGFIAYSDLTESDVVSWLTLEDDVESRLLSMIEEKKSPSTLAGTPWDVK